MRHGKEMPSACFRSCTRRPESDRIGSLPDFGRDKYRSFDMTLVRLKLDVLIYANGLAPTPTGYYCNPSANALVPTRIYPPGVASLGFAAYPVALPV